MPFGLTIYNDSGGMTLSADGYVYGYLGQATLTEIIQPPSGDVSLSECGYSTYQFTWPGDIVVALPVRPYGVTALLWQFRVGDTWTIAVHQSTSGAANNLGYVAQEATQVYVFGAPGVVPSDYGLALYSQTGQLTGDLSRRPLTFDRLLTFGANTTNAAFSGLTTPCVIGADPRYELSNLPYDQDRFDNRLALGGWRWNQSSGLLVRTLFQRTLERTTDQQGAQNAVPATVAVLLDAATL